MAESIEVKEFLVKLIMLCLNIVNSLELLLPYTIYYLVDLENSSFFDLYKLSSITF